MEISVNFQQIELLKKLLDVTNNHIDEEVASD